jgi:alkaline phosphatase D
MAARYRRQRAFPPLQNLLTATSHIAIWDDHDYGPNDSDASYRLKKATLKLFQRYWPSASRARPDVPGTFASARHGDVLFFLLDDRYYRSPNRAPDGPEKTMFGARQLEWLKEALVAAPRSAIKIVAGGSQFWNRATRFEGWHHFATERAAFADWLVSQRIEGLVFVSGDRHFGELLKVERAGAYPLHEFTSSPLTSRPPTRIDAADRDNPDVVPGTLVAKRQFGLIRVSGPGDNRRIAMEARDTEGSLLWRQEVDSASLRFPRNAQRAP